MAGAEDHSLSAQLSSMSLKQAVDECVEDAQAFMIPPTSPTKKPTESGVAGALPADAGSESVAGSAGAPAAVDDEWARWKAKDTSEFPHPDAAKDFKKEQAVEYLDVFRIPIAPLED